MCNVLLIELLGYFLQLSHDEISTIAVLATTAAGFLVLNEVSLPMTRMRKILISGLWIFFLGAVFLFPALFSLVILQWWGLAVLAASLFFCFPVFLGWSRLCRIFLDRKEKE